VKNQFYYIFLIALSAGCTGYRHLFDINASTTGNPCTDAIALSTKTSFAWGQMNFSGVPSGFNANEASGFMEYSCSDDKILFLPAALSNDTWVFDAAQNSWSEIATNTPSCDRGWGIKYHPPTNQFYIFCGQLGASFTTDVWTFSMATSTYTLRSTGGITSRNTPMVAWDSKRDRFFIFGGCNSSASCFNGNLLNDTYSYDPYSFSYQNLSATSPPSVRRGSQIEYDKVNDRILLFGGAQDNGATLLGDTCVYDPILNSWSCSTPANSPSCNGYEGSFTYAESMQAVILFGGRNGASCADLRSLVGNPTATWTQLSQGTSPTARGAHGTIYDQRRNRLVLYGGRQCPGATCFDMWELLF